MPKEVISILDDDYVVQVNWGIDTTVQVSTHAADPSRGNEGEEGWYVDLDRQAINRLIKVLRRARDQAFGADA